MLTKITKNRCLVLIITVVLTVNFVNVFPVQASTDQNIAGAWDNALKYSQDNPAKLNSFFAPWMSALALGAKGDPLVNSITVTPDLGKPASIASSIIGLMAKGQNPTQIEIGGEVNNLVDMLVNMQDPTSGSFKNTTSDTLNNTIWSVIALDMYNCNYSSVPVTYDDDAAANYIKAQQRTSGAFCEWVNNANSQAAADDVDSTAHVLLALAGHTTAEDLTVQKALAYLQNDNLQSATGAINSGWGDSPDSTAAVIEALIALNISPQGAEWTKEGKTLVDGLLAHQQLDGSFIEPGSWGDVNSMGSALCALVDLVNGYSKYRTRLPLVWLKVTGTTVISSGKDCDLSVTVKNPSANARDNLIIAALYDPQGKMVTYSYAQYHLSAGEERTAGLGFGSNIVAGSQVKVMVWDNWQQRTPLCSPVVIPVQ